MSIKNIISFLLLSSILSIIFINTKNYYVLAFFGILSIFLLLKLGYKYLIICGIVFLFFLFYRVNTKPDIINQESITINVKVIEAKEKYLIVKNDDVRYLVYVDDTYYKNDTLLISGNIKEIENDLDLYIFEFKDYLNNKRVFFKIENPSIELVNRNIPLSTKVINFLTSKLENESYTFSKMLLFNEAKVNEEVYENLKSINALHLFVVSGFHINFLFTLLSFVFKKKDISTNIIKLLIIGIYVFILDFSISSSRAMICLALKVIFDKKITNFDCLGISGLLMLLVEPLNVFNYSFIMTYVISYSLAFLSKANESKNKILNALTTSLVCLLSLLPIQLIMNYKINFISLFTNIVLNYVVMVLFVFSLIGLVVSIFNGDIFSFIYKYFFKAIDYVNDNTKSIIFGHPSSMTIIIYYVLFILFLIALENKKVKQIILSLCSIVIGLILFYNKNYFINYEQLTFLNVSQGDCSIIMDKHMSNVTLIDTGGLKYQDVALKKIIPYLEYHGIKKIDTVIITHDDFDHNGALDSLLLNFNVLNVIDDNSIEEINCGSITLKNLNIDANYEETNNNSIVLYGNICGYDILFMGDASKLIESNIMEEYGYLNVDILKVGHHGSKTSSSSEFIDFYCPEISIISVGYNNYGHPHKEVLENLANTKIYRTDTNGTIKIEYDYLKGYYIKTAK